MHSQKRTTIARLRTDIGLSVQEFAELIGKSIHTIHKLETGVLPLSEETAFKIALETGVAPEWLLEGSPEETPYWTDPFNDHRLPWNKQRFESVQAASGIRYVTKHTRARTIVRMLVPIAPWLAIYAKAESEGKADLANYLLSRSLKDLEKRLGRDDSQAATAVKKTRLITPEGEDWAFKLGGDNRIILSQIEEP